MVVPSAYFCLVCLAFSGGSSSSDFNSVSSEFWLATVFVDVAASSPVDSGRLVENVLGFHTFPFG